MEIHRIIQAGVPLYRYDLTEPPKGGWNMEYKSPIYYWDEAGPKNEIGAFFFFDNKSDAIEVGKNALVLKETMIKTYNPELSIWITKTIIQDELYMLDLSKCKDVIDLYVVLWNEQIDIFRDDFYRFDYLRGSRPLLQIKDDTEYIVSHKDLPKTSKWSECKYNIDIFSSGSDDKIKLAYASQGLTDFSNGKIFKKLLDAKGYDGYIFRESDANTFCLFNSEKISLPEVTLIHS
jgi:hypothetical protein